MKFAETIHSSGTDLLSLINDILDLTKIESGTMAVEPSEVRLDEMRDYVNRNFRHVADGKGLEFVVDLRADLPRIMTTDLKRLQQVIKNLLSNALKFTEHGKVSLRVERATKGWQPDNPVLANAESVVAFSVEDTGIGIPLDKQRIIFEAFQQADGTTSRKYGGTGLGLSISREIAHLLGGEIRLHSVPGVGSTFTLYLPLTYAAPMPHRAGAEGRAQVTRSAASAAESMIAAARLKPTLLARAVQDDDRETIMPGDRVLLVIDDDSTYSRIVLDAAHEREYKVLVAAAATWVWRWRASSGPTPCCSISACRTPPAGPCSTSSSTIPTCGTFPIHVLSIYEDRRRGLELGATSYSRKVEGREVIESVFDRVKDSIERRAREVLVINSDEATRQRDRRYARNPGRAHRVPGDRRRRRSTSSAPIATTA